MGVSPGASPNVASESLGRLWKPCELQPGQGLLPRCLLLPVAPRLSDPSPVRYRHLLLQGEQWGQARVVRTGKGTLSHWSVPQGGTQSREEMLTSAAKHGTVKQPHT